MGCSKTSSLAMQELHAYIQNYKYSIKDVVFIVRDTWQIARGGYCKQGYGLMG